jgi:hypothetical protein
MNPRNGILAAAPMDIANRHHLHASIAQEMLQVSPPHDAHADETQVDAAVGPLPLPVLGMHRRIENKRRRQTRRRGGQELTTLQMFSAHSCTSLL